MVSSMVDINKMSKSGFVGLGCGEGVTVGDDAVAGGSGLGPYPALADVVVVEVAPKVVLSSLGASPFPGLFDGQFGSIHVIHVVSVSEGGHLGVRSEGVLAHLGAHDVAGHFQSSDGVGEGDDTSGPAFVEGSVGMIVGGEDGV